MNTLSHARPLVFYDGVELFEAQDIIGGRYLCLLVESMPQTDRYIAVGVTPQHLRAFKQGSLDLRTLIIEREIAPWFLVETAGDLDRDLPLLPQIETDIPEAFLPNAGFFLAGYEPFSDEVVREAKTHNNLVLELRTDPPEAASEPRIRPTTLSGLLNLLQQFIKHAYNKAIAKLDQSSRQGLDIGTAYLMDVYAGTIS